MKQKLLFVCSRNRQRSLTAETILHDNAAIDVKSAGTETVARVRVTAGLLNWADVIFAMERRHLDRLHRKFAEILGDKSIIILSIPDDYAYMDEELTDILMNRVAEYIDL
ncbi:low molecular weight protein tyrosine phosphatase family protein [Spirosoma arcticum]